MYIRNIYMLFEKTSYSFVLDLYFSFFLLTARIKRKKSNQKKEKSRAFAMQRLSLLLNKKARFYISTLLSLAKQEIQAEGL